MNGLLEMNISQLFLFGIIFSLFLFLSPIIFYSLVIFSIKKSTINKNPINLLANESTEKKNRALIVIPILNGASRIKERITNIVNNCSPSDFEIIIISDGSRDNTYEEALKHSKLLREKGWKLDVINNDLNIGRAASHNKAVEKYNNDIMIFTDLDTRFSKTFPQNALEFLRKNSNVGAVSAEVKFESNTLYGKFFSNLFNFELLIRTLSVKAGLAMKGSGPAIAIKKEIWEKLEDFEDIDHCVGFMCSNCAKDFIYSKDWFVFDYANPNAKKDFKARSRMTRKSLLSFQFQLNKYKYNKLSNLKLIGYILHKPIRFISIILIFFFLIMYMLSVLNLYIFLLVIFTTYFFKPLRLFFIVPSSYISGIYGWLTKNKVGTYKPVNSFESEG